ncbi:SigE family RNA polymerase sigma factor [Micromonospora cremea]|uniref:RNA polymerase sigma-70 factor, sigma-E family n=1 Tax=Micromonospora cremea TaxID=709881 RepID=A0A1N6A443_9ACTN|nr:RNA polymerase sigma-70 factor, sigma-E family [Micromonospora cremea]
MAGLPVDVEGYRDYVGVRLEPLRRTAYLLCGDWHTADDLVSTALVKLLRHWPRVSVMDNPDAYVRRTLLRVWLDERRRPWRREAAWAEVPDHPVVAGGTDGAADQLTVLALLAELPPRRRAVLVLLYFCDLSVEETAREIGCTPGTVKSQSARAIETLRGRLVDLPPPTEEVRTNG